MGFFKIIEKSFNSALQITLESIINELEKDESLGATISQIDIQGNVYTVNGDLLLSNNVGGNNPTYGIIQQNIKDKGDQIKQLQDLVDVDTSTFNGNALTATTAASCSGNAATASAAAEGSELANQLAAIPQGVPIGTIVMWSGAPIPTGWSTCDGGTYNGTATPDLRDKFVVGSGNSYIQGQAGGASSKTLSIDEMPNHDHGLTINAAGNHTHTAEIAAFNGGTGNIGFATYNQYLGPNTLSYSGDHEHSHSMDKVGGGVSFEILPPYYALQYIMFTG